MPGGTRKVAASRSAAAGRSSSTRKASPASARLGRRMTSAQSGQRATSGGQRSTGGPSARSWQQLYQEAKAKNIKGRSGMTKAELERALSR